MFSVKKIKDYAIKLFESWGEDERQIFFSMIERKDGCSLVDLGCGDGSITKRVAEIAHAGKVVGFEGIDFKNTQDIKNFTFIKGELNDPLPFSDNEFDVVISHFSLEHLYNTGQFIKETHRILKPGGYIIVATDNLSAWPNIIALILGWQPFSSAHGIAHRALGNPFALRSGGGGGGRC